MVSDSISLIAAALWVSVPPLVIWAVWMLSRPARAVPEHDTNPVGATFDASGSRALDASREPARITPREQAPAYRSRDTN